MNNFVSTEDLNLFITITNESAYFSRDFLAQFANIDTAISNYYVMKEFHSAPMSPVSDAGDAMSSPHSPILERPGPLSDESIDAEEEVSRNEIEVEGAQASSLEAVAESRVEDSDESESRESTGIIQDHKDQEDANSSDEQSPNIDNATESYTDFDETWATAYFDSRRDVDKIAEKLVDLQGCSITELSDYTIKRLSEPLTQKTRFVNDDPSSSKTKNNYTFSSSQSGRIWSALCNPILILKGSSAKYQSKHQKDPTSPNEWPKYLGSVSVKCELTDSMFFSSINIHDELTLEPGQFEFKYVKTYHSKSIGNKETKKFTREKCYIKSDSVYLRCLWKGEPVGRLRSNYEEVLAILLVKKYIKVDCTLITYPNINFRDVESYTDSKFEVLAQLDIFLTEEVILNPLTRSTHIASAIASKKEEENGDDQVNLIEEDENQHSAKLIRQSFVRLFNLLKVHVSIPTTVVPKQRSNPIQSLLKEKHGKKFDFESKLVTELITKDFSSYYAISSKDANDDEDDDYSRPELKLEAVDKKSSVANEEEKKQDLFTTSDQITNYYTLSEPQSTFTSDLYAYQKQALSWMLFREGKITEEQLFTADYEEARKLSDLFKELTFLDGSKLYFNPFNSEFSTTIPKLKACKGGVLADQMGLGKTVMMIALMHTNKRVTKLNSRSNLDSEELEKIDDDIDEEDESTNRRSARLRAKATKKLKTEQSPTEFVLHKVDEVSSRRVEKVQPASEIASSKVSMDEIEDPDVMIARQILMSMEQNDSINLNKEISLNSQADEHAPDLNTISYEKPASPEKVIQESKLKSAGTLIIVPLTVLSQWGSELIGHSETASINILQYYGSSRSSHNLSSYDVVITTYGILRTEFVKHRDKRGHGIFDYEWFRVVLDEAHNIKSNKTESAKAACHLEAENRWCLTGTPLQNKPDDMFSLFKFLRLDTWGDYFWWNNYVNNSTETRSERLIRTILKPLLLRRNKMSTYQDGRRILDLPQKISNVTYVEMSGEERKIYACLFDKGTKFLQELTEDDQMGNVFTCVFALSMRLRQICDHPSLIFSKQDLRNKKTLEAAVRKFLNMGKQRGKFVNETICKLKSRDLEPCAVCTQDIADPVMAVCGHIYCKECLNDVIDKFKRCALCHTEVSTEDVMAIELGEKINNREIMDVDCTTFKMSSKIKAVIDSIAEVEKKGEKCVVFSQFIGMMNLIERFMSEAGIKSTRIDGSQSLATRRENIARFGTDEALTVILISFKAGCVGLNLTVANHVFLVDPWWNPAIEDQAVDRIHRIGQNKTVYVNRFICKDTIEERVLELNTRKRIMIQNILHYNQEGQKKQNLEDLMYVLKEF